MQIIRVCSRPPTAPSYSSHTTPFNYTIVAQLVTSLPQGPTKSVTASTIIPSASTFYVGSYDGRIISGSIDTGLENVNGDGHTNLVSGLTGADGGRAWSVGYDDVIREITANGFSWVHRHYMGVQSILALMRPSNRPTSGSTNGQPKGVASADDGTVFVVTTNGVEVYAGGNVGKTVAYLPLKANLNCIAVHGKMVAVGGEVRLSGSSLNIPSGVLIIIVPGPETLFVYVGRHIIEGGGEL